jgi:hypothetical protein
MLNANRLVIGICALAILSSGCATTATTANYQRSNLTFGMVKKNLVKGQTAQSEVLSLFGAPNITTLNKSGEEVWTYDKVAVSNEDISGGIGIGNSSGGVIGGAGVSGSSSSTSSRSITLMITFDSKDIVKDYAVMAQEF